MTRPLYEIASEISADWQPVYFGAVPYLNALHHLENINSRFYQDSADSIVRYFLCNARTWKGDVARRVKAELNQLLKGKA